MTPSVHNLANFPTEILNRIASELIADSYITDHISFGPSLQSLSLVCKRFNAICASLRYYDWELVSEEPFSRFRQHLEIPAWGSSVKILTIPVRDFRTDCHRQVVDLETYDAHLAEVVASIDGLVRLTLAFGDWRLTDEDVASRPALRKTIAACLLRTEVHDLAMYGISTRSACDEARYLIAQWHGLECLRISCEPIEDPVQHEIGPLLWTSATQREGLERLEFRVELFRHELSQATAYEFPAAQAQLQCLYLPWSESNPYSSSPPILYKMLRSVGNISSVAITLQDLDASTRKSHLSLSLPRLRQLQLQISSHHDETCANPDIKYGLLASHLRMDNSLLCKTSLLEYLHLTEDHAMLFLRVLVQEPLPPSLKRISLCERSYAYYEGYWTFNEARDAYKRIGIHLYETYHALYHDTLP